MIDFVKIPEERMKILRRDRMLKEQLEKFTDAKIKLGNDVEVVADDPLLVLKAKDIVKAFGRGFDTKDALNLLDDEYFLDTIEIKDFAGRSQKRMEILRGRVIGTAGKTKRMIEEFTDSKVSVYGKTVSIIGRWNKVKIAREAIEMLLCGRLHSSVYRFLEKQKSVM